DLRGKGAGRLVTGREERKTTGGCDSARKSDRGGPAGHRRGDDRQPGVQQWCVHAGFFPTFRTGQCPEPPKRATGRGGDAVMGTLWSPCAGSASGRSHQEIVFSCRGHCHHFTDIPSRRCPTRSTRTTSSPSGTS